MPEQPMIITIDGPAGAGKSTIARQLAKELGIFYLDTGAMYRALTLKALREKVNLEDENRLVELARRTRIDFKKDAAGHLAVHLDGEDVSQEIRTLEVTNKTFYTARAPRVREIMVQWQRSIGERMSLVGEGRDLGTVVYPKATYKFYLDADSEERCRRRIKELKEQGKVFDEEQLKRDLLERDQKDMTRAVGPLRKAADAIVIDSTPLTADQVTATLLNHIRRRP